jgi:hypothetical protein
MDSQWPLFGSSTYTRKWLLGSVEESGSKSEKTEEDQSLILDMVPRGGIEFSAIRLELRRFLNDDFLVYPLMYPAFRTVWQHQKPFICARCAHFNGRSLAPAMLHKLDHCSPKAKVTRSNRVGHATSVGHRHQTPPIARSKIVACRVTRSAPPAVPHELSRSRHAP